LRSHRVDCFEIEIEGCRRAAFSLGRHVYLKRQKAIAALKRPPISGSESRFLAKSGSE
jgi:hypothetical protein